jgi:hypothetical protein
VLLVALILGVSCATLTQKVNATVNVGFYSKQDNLATVNLGTVTIGPPVSNTYLLDVGVGLQLQNYAITYNPAAGYFFLRWETSGQVSVSNTNTQTTTLTVTAGDINNKVQAIYTLSPRLVGGVIVPTNTLTVLAPYLAMIGLVTVAATVYVTKRRC